MSKTFTILTIVLGVMAMFAMFGITDSSTSQLLRVLSFDSIEDLKQFDFFKLVFGTAGVIALLGAASAVTIGLFSRTSYDSIIIAGFVGLLAGWIIGDMYSLIATAQTWGTEFPFFAQLIKLYWVVFIGVTLITLIQFWRGAD